MGVALGVASGLGVAWGIAPVQFSNADPADLRSTYKDDYLRMISAAYELDGDLPTARGRLSQLGLANPAQALDDLVQYEQQNGARPETLGALARFAQDAGFRLSSPVVIMPPESSAIVISPAQTPPAVIFNLAEKTALSCTDQPDRAQLKFVVRDAQGRELPNIAIEIHWEAGEEVIYTGLKPEQGSGYADFEAEPGKYSAKIQNSTGENVTELNIAAPPAHCKNDRGATPRGWKIVFKQK